MSGGVDILMITFNRPAYVARTLPALLDGCGDDARVWVWHNGTDEETLAAVRAVSDHRRLFRFHHSEENVGLREPTNWLWRGAEGDFVSKVDDDCLLEEGWYRRLAEAHAANPSLGAIGASRLRDGEFVPELAHRKIEDLAGGHRIMRNLWVQGSGYLLKRRTVGEVGLLRDGQSFPQYCVQLERHGYVNGYYFPLIREEHMDDPRSPYSLLRTDEDLQRYGPLSAKRNGVTTLAEWEAQLRRSALTVQEASLDIRQYVGWRRRAKGLKRRLLRRPAW